MRLVNVIHAMIAAAVIVSQSYGALARDTKTVDVDVVVEGVRMTLKLEVPAQSATASELDTAFSWSQPRYVIAPQNEVGGPDGAARIAERVRACLPKADVTVARIPFEADQNAVRLGPFPWREAEAVSRAIEGCSITAYTASVDRL